MTWDGTDEQGHKLPNGVYLVVVELKNDPKLTIKMIVKR
ncbi:MAG: hypothetical protein JNN12_13945 [Bacteroidetes Order II. Incertae sedis bacterium]|nr:hypothetical protein [Bacteroidetes Order II. bacterium]